MYLGKSSDCEQKKNSLHGPVAWKLTVPVPHLKGSILYCFLCASVIKLEQYVNQNLEDSV